MITIKVKNKNWTIAEFKWQKWSSLLAQAEQNGIKIDSSCRRGTCWLCMCKIKSGHEHLAGIRKNYSFNSNMTFTCDTTIKDENWEWIVEIEV